MFNIENFLDNYLLFLAQALTIFAIIAVVIILIASIASHKEPKEKLEIKKLNERYDAYNDTLREHTLDKEAFKKYRKDKKQQRKKDSRDIKHNIPRKRVFAIDFHGDIKASAVTALAEEITAILLIATPEDEIFVTLYSAGGLVHTYGLAASQLQRIRRHGIPLTVSVDKVAASGGYMMACVANRIIAAPFAIIGSIGVVAQIPNFHRLLQRHDIDFELHTAGEYKRTLTVFGENTPEARKKFKQDLEETHQLFQDFITENRPQVDIKRVATGEYWHGTQAFELNLVDKLVTSDDYLLDASKECDIYKVSYTSKPSLTEKLATLTRGIFEKVDGIIRQKEREDRLI